MVEARAVIERTSQFGGPESNSLRRLAWRRSSANLFGTSDGRSWSAGSRESYGDRASASQAMSSLFLAQPEDGLGAC